MTQIQVKICGITQQEQAIEISKLGVDALGFILYPPSKRYIDPDQILSITKSIPPYTKTVGVVVNESLDNLSDLYQKSGLDIMQLHGNESPEYCKEATDRNIRWIKAFRVKEDFDFQILKIFPEKSFLLDAWDEAEYGGTGKTLQWDQLISICQNYQIILAGGITPENVNTAISSCNPAGIDLSSGVEIEPGNKSLEKIKTLLKNMNL